MTEPVGIGVVGCGRIARMFHLPALAASPSVRLLAVADADAAAREAARTVAGDARAVSDTQGLLAVPGVEAVVVCVPTHAHVEAGVTALDAGVAVYVEKPLAPSLDEALHLRDAWRRSGRLGAVGFNFRFHPLVRAAAGHLRRGAVGQLVAIRTVLASSPRQLPAWKQDRRTGGGALLDLASHHIDTVRFLTGEEVVTAAAAIRSVRTPEDTAALQLRLSSGVAVQVLVSTCAAQTDRIEVTGDRATLHVDRMGRRRVLIEPALPPSTRSERLRAARHAVTDGLSATLGRLRPPAEPSFAAALEAFATGVRTGRFDGATIDDGVAGLGVVEAAERAATSGTEERVEAPPDAA